MVLKYFIHLVLFGQLFFRTVTGQCGMFSLSQLESVNCLSLMKQDDQAWNILTDLPLQDFCDEDKVEMTLWCSEHCASDWSPWSACSCLYVYLSASHLRTSHFTWQWTFEGVARERKWGKEQLPMQMCAACSQTSTAPWLCLRVQFATKGVPMEEWLPMANVLTVLMTELGPAVNQVPVCPVV